MKKKKSTPVLTEMQKFAVDLMNAEQREINPNFLAHRWAEHKHQRFGCSSRRMFGTTTAAYKTMRKLVLIGVATCRADHYYTLKKKL